MAEVVVQLAKPESSTGSPFEAASSLGLKLERTHPGTRDQNLSRWYHVNVSTPTKVDSLLNELRKDPEVSAAFVKPAAEPP